VDDKATRWTHYEAIPPLTGPSGVQETVFNGQQIYSAKFAITNKASKEQQIAAIKIADYIYSKEGSLDEMFGIKGKGWLEPKAGDLGVDGKPALFRRGNVNPDKPGNIMWDNDFTNLTAEMYDGQQASQDPNTIEGYERYLYLQTKDKYDGHHPSEILLNDVVDPAKAQQVAQMKTDIVNYVQASAVQFIMGQKSLDKDWDAYVNQLKTLGVDEYVQDYQDSYDKMNK
jgi:putative aldouronate transport system substrate-binding protein